MLKAAGLKDDIISSIVVFLVAIPLCLGIALASGAPLFSGIISGVIGGIVVGLLSESQVSVSGPAAGMIAVVIAAISQLGGFQPFLLAVLIAGIIQIIIGTLKAGFVADYVPSNVIRGLLAAIGILIIIKQLPLAFGYAKAETFLQSLKIAQETFSFAPLVHLTTHVNPSATLISIISFAILIYWNKIPANICKVIPAAIIAVIVAAIINVILSLFWPSYALDSTFLVNIPVNGDINGFLSQFILPDFSQLANANIYLYAAMIAIVASLETLLNLEAAEKLDKKRRYCSRNKELIAQGVGNTLSGLIGGLPITSVIVRSSVNIHTGAKTKRSAIFHGILLFIAAALFPEWLNKIPIAALAAILIHTGYKLARVELFREMYSQGFEHFFPFIVTVVAIVITNLLLGILIGLATSIFFILKYNSQNCFDIVEEKHTSGNILRLILPQQVSFLNKAAIINELREIPSNSKAIIDAQYSDYIDLDILEVIKEFRERQAIEKNIALNLSGFKEHYDIHDHIEFINVTTHDVQNHLTPTRIFNILKEGNQRFLEDKPIHKNYHQQISATAQAQHPIAVVLGCIDSRVPVEVIFDLGVGDVFVVRNAGNVANEDIMASIEFACHVAGAKLIVVLGHVNCGAIKAACDDIKLGHITQLVERIKPAITAENKIKTNRDGNNQQFVTNVTKINIQNTKEYLYNHSDILREEIDKQNIALIGALYDVNTGKVFFEDLL